MGYLILVSTIWAFSFGLTKGELRAVDPSLVTLIRLFLAFLVFLPFLRLRKVPRALAAKLALIGALQFGIMYLAYHWSFQSLKAHEVALFTVLTPIYVTLIHDGVRRRFRPRLLLTALGAIAGVLILKYPFDWRISSFQGFALVQLSNLAFAAGQVGYREVRRDLLRHGAADDFPEFRVFALLYLGAVVITALPFLFRPAALAPLATLSGREIGVLLYLGAVASGLCFFWWNLGAVRTAPGPLAVLNNLKIPAAVAVSLLVFGEAGSVTKLVLGGGILLLSAAIAARQDDSHSLESVN